MWIDIFSDVVCPWCFIGKRRLERALRDRPVAGLEIRWRAFQLNPGMPKTGMDRQDYLATKFGGPGRAAQIYETIRKIGPAEGIDFDFAAIKVTPNTVDAHRLISLAQDQGGSDLLVEALFNAYFLEGRNLGDHSVLIDIGRSTGVDEAAIRHLFDGDERVDEVEADCQAAVHLGINGVPCFIMEGRYALSGAQEPEAFTPLFDLMAQEGTLASGRLASGD